MVTTGADDHVDAEPAQDAGEPQHPGGDAAKPPRSGAQQPLPGPPEPGEKHNRRILPEDRPYPLQAPPVTRLDHEHEPGAAAPQSLADSDSVPGMPAAASNDSDNDSHANPAPEQHMWLGFIGH